MTVEGSASIPTEASEPIKRVRVTRKSFLLPPVEVMGHEVSMTELMDGVVAQRELARSVWSHLDDNEKFQFFVTVQPSESSNVSDMALKGRVKMQKRRGCRRCVVTLLSGTLHSAAQERVCPHCSTRESTGTVAYRCARQTKYSAENFAKVALLSN